MTRKDYVLLAEAIKNCNVNDDEQFGVDACAECIADALAADNPRFDRARFLKAAGVTL